MNKSCRTITRSADETRALGAKLGTAIRHTPESVVIALRGDLGAGKTTLVSGMLRALGVDGVVRSPTYTLIEPYEASGRLIFHLDLYRLASADELEMLAPRDLLEPGVVILVEWPERAGRALPPVDLEITLTYPETVQGDDRTIDLRANSQLGMRLAQGSEP